MKLKPWLSLYAFAILLQSSGALSGVFHNETELACFQAQKIPTQDQCLFVREHCSDLGYQIGNMDYLRFYYCSHTRKGSLALIFGGILLCFVSLALTASDYLCPNLYSISRFLQLSDNLAGLTLLALGNGAPDVLSTFKALEVEATGLAVSELMGAALFILTVVVGAISWARPFKVPKFHFVRDILFYLAISFICLLLLMMGKLTYWSSVLLFSTYAIYVVVVLFSHSVLWANVMHSVNIARLRSTYDEESVSDLGDSRIEYFIADHVPHPSIDTLTSSVLYPEEREEFDAFLNTHPHNARDERALLETGSYGLKLLLKNLSKHSLDLSQIPSAVTLTNDRPLTAIGTPEPVENSDTITPDNTAVVPSAGELKKINLSWTSLIFPSIDSSANLLNKVHAIITYPTNIVLRLTTPNREQAIDYAQSLSYNAFNFNTSAMDTSLDEDTSAFDYELDMKLFKVQLVAFPVFVALSCFQTSWLLWTILPFIVILFYGITFFVPKDCADLKSFTWSHAIWNYMGSFIGFIASIIWVSTFATEIVAMLKAISVIFAISDEVLGATVFALGNSVGDLVSNIIIARMGMPVMAFGACFGGPLLSISSLGLSATIIMYKQGTSQISIDFSSPLKLNCFALILALIFLAVSIPWNGWKFDRKIGAVLVLIWIGSCLLTIISGL